MAKKIEEPKIPTVSESVSVYYNTLQTVIETADRLIEKYPETLKSYKDFFIDNYDEPYSDGTYPHLMYQRPETPKETAKREKEAKEWADRQAEWDRKNYERLKKQFEKG